LHIYQVSTLKINPFGNLEQLNAKGQVGYLMKDLHRNIQVTLDDFGCPVYDLLFCLFVCLFVVVLLFLFVFFWLPKTFNHTG
jgi:hypothetical protein